MLPQSIMMAIDSIKSTIMRETVEVTLEGLFVEPSIPVSAAPIVVVCWIVVEGLA